MFRRLCSPTGLALLTAALLFLFGRDAFAQLRRDGDAVALPSGFPGFPNNSSPFSDIAYDARNRVYLVVAADFLKVSGVFVDSAGRPLTSAFLIHENLLGSEIPDFVVRELRVVYSADVSDGVGGFGGFLVVWSQQRVSCCFPPFTGDEVHARIVAFPAGLVGGDSGIQGFDILLDNVAYSETSKLFLLGWSERAGGFFGSPRSTVVRTLGVDGQPVGSPTTIWPAHSEQAIAWDRSRDEFVVAYLEVLGDTSLVLARVATDRTVRRRDVVVTVPGTGSFGIGSVFGIDVSFSPRTGNLLVTWREGPIGSPIDLHAAEIDPAGSIVSTGLVLKGHIGQHSIAYNAASATFLLAGACLPPQPSPLGGVCAIELNEHGAPISGVVTGSTAISPNEFEAPAVVSRPEAGGWLVSFTDGIPFLQAFQTSALCQSPDPFSTLGGGVCVNGGWLPFGHPGIGRNVAPAPPSSPPPSPTGCSSSDPFLSLGGGVCVNGGWVPPGFPETGGSPPPSPQPPGPAPAGCSGPDPFASLPTLIGRCVNGGWIPVPGIKSAGTVRFFAIGAGLWVIEGSDGTLYEPSGGLDSAFQTAGLAVFVEAELIPTGTPSLPQAKVVAIQTIVMSVSSW